MAGQSLRETLLASGRHRWLDVGNGGQADDGFVLVDTYRVELMSRELQSRYHRMSMVDPPADFVERLGQFDFVRAQHVVEHMDYEEGGRFLENCAKLMPSGSILLLTVPDLRRHIEWYLAGYPDQNGFRAWATTRVPADAPPSMIFSVHSHNMPFEPHKWCYDEAGLVYQVTRTGLFKNIIILPLDHSLAETPFTHNRPDEDLCVMAVRR